MPDAYLGILLCKTVHLFIYFERVTGNKQSEEVAERNHRDIRWLTSQILVATGAEPS